MASLRDLLLVTLFLLTYIPPSLAALRNVTVDDESGDSETGIIPTYIRAWQQGATCTECIVQPDKNFAFEGTWHDSTSHPDGDGFRAMQINFTGTCVFFFASCLGLVIEQ